MLVQLHEAKKGLALALEPNFDLTGEQLHVQLDNHQRITPYPAYKYRKVKKK